MHDLNVFDARLYTQLEALEGYLKKNKQENVVVHHDRDEMPVTIYAVSQQMRNLNDSQQKIKKEAKNSVLGCQERSEPGICLVS